MVTSLTVDNVNQALPIALNIFRMSDEKSLRDVVVRGKRRIELRSPFVTEYLNPLERVLFSPVRDANPFFHFMESLWILAGRDDVEWLAQWLPRIADYSDDGLTFHGAYGARLQVNGQLNGMLKRFRVDQNTTRAVLALYQPLQDAWYEGKDLPCNDMLMFQLREDKLSLTVCNRSNDLVWGAYGANVVQFSTLLEYVAGRLGPEVGIGRYVQFSTNTHIYPDEPSTQRCMEHVTLLDEHQHAYDHTAAILPYRMFDPEVSAAGWDRDLMQFLQACDVGQVHQPHRLAYAHRYFKEVATPMALSHQAFRHKHYHVALEFARQIQATDWRLACVKWLERRVAKAAERK